MRIPKLKLGIGLFSLVAFVAAGFLGLHQVSKPAKTVIKTQAAQPGLTEGNVTGGVNQAPRADKNTLQTTGQLTYESPEVATNQPKTNLVGLIWDQHGSPAGTVAEIRIFDGSKWTAWTQVDGDDKPDKAGETTQSAPVLTSNARQVQYRFTLNGSGQPVSVSSPRLAFIDSTQGPDPTRQNIAQKILGGTAKAAFQGPRIYSRAEWGCPQPDSSPAWPPNYWGPLGRVMVHHTVTAGDPGNSAAEVRGVWQYHTYTNGWGDIGYNYLVDKNGNIFQGRYFDQAYADANHVEVEGGHTYGFNDYSVGIAALGNFQTGGTTSGLNEGISNIAGYKMAPYGIHPWDQYTDEGVPAKTPDGTPPRGGRVQYRLAGHRDYLSTECPGGNLYAQLGNIRNRATQFADQYGIQRYWDYSYQGQGVNGVSSNQVNLRNGQTATLYLDLKNEGQNTWLNNGSTPVRLGTDRPPNRGSGFASGWLANNRPGTFTQKVVSGTPQSASSIAPGEIARFTFNVTNPNLNGTFPEFFRPVVEGVTYFPRDAGMWWQINAVPDIYQSAFVYQTYGVPSVPGATGTNTLTLKNTGNVAWVKSGASTIRLGTDRPMDRSSAIYDSSWTSTNRVGSFAGKAQLDGSGNQVKDGSGNPLYDNTATTIQPGEAAVWSFTVKAPNTTTHTHEFFRPVIEGQGWLNDLGIWWPVDVNAGYSASFAGQSAAPTISKANSGNGIGVMYFDFTNTGGVAWLKNGSNPVHLGTDHPRDRGSGFATFGLTSSSTPPLPANTQDWLGTNRVNSFAGKVVSGTLDTSATSIQPGETGRFMIALDARSVPVGQYPEWFSPVAEGIGWLYYGTWLPITVQP